MQGKFKNPGGSGAGHGELAVSILFSPRCIHGAAKPRPSVTPRLVAPVRMCRKAPLVVPAPKGSFRPAPMMLTLLWYMVQPRCCKPLASTAHPPVDQANCRSLLPALQVPSFDLPSARCASPYFNTRFFHTDDRCDLLLLLPHPVALVVLLPLPMFRTNVARSP